MAAIGSHRFFLLTERESGPGNSRLNREKGVLLACSGTAPLALQARWLIWFQCLVLTLAWHSTLCLLLLSAWGDVAHVTSDRLKGLIDTMCNTYRVHKGYIISLKLWYQIKRWHRLLHIKFYIFEIGQKPTKKPMVTQWFSQHSPRLQTCQYQLFTGSAEVIMCH